MTLIFFSYLWLFYNWWCDKQVKCVYAPQTHRDRRWRGLAFKAKALTLKQMKGDHGLIYISYRFSFFLFAVDYLCRLTSSTKVSLNFWCLCHRHLVTNFWSKNWQLFHDPHDDIWRSQILGTYRWFAADTNFLPSYNVLVQSFWEHILSNCCLSKLIVKFNHVAHYQCNHLLRVAHLNKSDI